MPCKKKKYNSRFPPARIKKIMQTDEEIGKVAAAVPVIISRTIERFIQSLLSHAGQVTLSRNVRTLTPSHLKHCILSQPRLNFMLELCNDIPDSGNDPIPEAFKLPSNLIVNEVKEEKRVKEEDIKEPKFKRSISLPESNIPKRKRGRPRKIPSFVDDFNCESDAHSYVDQNNLKEEDEKGSSKINLPKYNTSLSNMSLSDAEDRKEDKRFTENVKMNIPGFGSSSLSVGSTMKENSSPSVCRSFNPFDSNADADVDENYD